MSEEYCTHCNQVFSRDELSPCEFMFSGSDKTIVTKTGVKEIKESGLECNGCKNYQHHKQGAWI